MTNKSIQVLVTNEEYELLEKKAAKEGLTVALYVKAKVLEENEFSKSYKELVNKVNKLPSGTRFNIRLLFGVDWTMTRGTKLTLGKTYYSRVKDGTIKNVDIEGKDTSNTMWYIKK